jgi:hypothetical protein
MQRDLEGVLPFKIDNWVSAKKSEVICDGFPCLKYLGQNSLMSQYH